MLNILILDGPYEQSDLNQCIDNTISNFSSKDENPDKNKEL